MYLVRFVSHRIIDEEKDIGYEEINIAYLICSDFCGWCWMGKGNGKFTEGIMAKRICRF